jgi:hypothetical protein
MKKMTITIILILLFLILKAPERRCLWIERTEPITTFDPMLYAFEKVESDFVCDTINQLGYGGILQIGQEMIDEVNKLCIKHKIPCQFTLDDRLDRKKSEHIWRIVQYYHNRKYDLQKACLIWNPKANAKYYMRIKKAMLVAKP